MFPFCYGYLDFKISFLRLVDAPLGSHGIEVSVVVL